MSTCNDPFTPHFSPKIEDGGSRIARANRRELALLNFVSLILEIDISTFAMNEQNYDESLPTTQPPPRPGQLTDAGKARIFPCDQCGADLEFHIGVGQLQCPFCGFTKEIELDPEKTVEEQDFHAMLERLAERRTTAVGLVSDETHEIRCDSCGGTVVFIGTPTSQDCAYCASPIQRENVHDAVDRVPVDGVLPFQVEKRQANGNLKAWVASLWFAPNEFRRRGVKGEFSGVYLPFWTFDALTFNRYEGRRGDDYTVEVGDGDDKRTVTRTDWTYVSGKFQRFFDDCIICASGGLPRQILEALEPWPMDQLVPFNQPMLAGLLARTYDVELSPGFELAKKQMEAAIRQETNSRIGGDHQRIDKLHTRFDAITYKHLLLPVWLLAYKYREKTYQVAINACTGEVQGERPWSWVKITFAVLGGLAVVLGLVIAFQS